MKQLIGQFKLHAVRHGDKVPLMDREEFPLNMRYRSVQRVCHIGLVVNGREFCGGAIYDILIVVRDLDPMVQRKDLR